MKYLRVLSCAACLVAGSLSAQETQWPRFQGVYLQMKDGEQIALPSLHYHPLQDHEAFGVAVLDDLPEVDPKEIDGLIFNGADYLYDSGDLDIEWGFLINAVDDPTSHCAMYCEGELIISQWSAKTNAFNIEYGPNHSLAHAQLALFAKPDHQALYQAYRSGVNKGSDPNEIPARAVMIKGACCYAYWAFRHKEE